jgi:hypothetical protein
MARSPLVGAIAKAKRSGPVSLVLGEMRSGGKVAVGGALIGRYLRVGGAVATGAQVVVLRAGAKTVVFTGVTKVNV